MANRRGKVEAVIDFLFLSSRIAADGDCSHEIKRHLLLRRKSMTNLDSILKSREIILPTKVKVANHIVKAMSFLVVMYGRESWTIKKAENLRLDAFKPWCWRRLRVPWTARSSNQSILKEINLEYLLEGLAEALILWPPHEKSGLIGKNPVAGKDWRQKENGVAEDEMARQHHQLNDHEFKQTPGDSGG